MAISNISHDPVTGQIPALVDLFAQFYGEEYRDRIRKNLDSAVYIFVDQSNYNPEKFMSGLSAKTAQWWSEFYSGLCEAMNLPINPTVLNMTSISDFHPIINDLLVLQNKYVKNGKIPVDSEAATSLLAQIIKPLESKDVEGRFREIANLQLTKQDLNGQEVGELVEKALSYFTDAKLVEYVILEEFNAVPISQARSDHEDEYEKQFYTKCRDYLYDYILRSFDKKPNKNNADLKKSLNTYLSMILDGADGSPRPTKSDIQWQFNIILNTVLGDKKFYSYEEILANKKLMDIFLNPAVIEQIFKFRQERDSLIEASRADPFGAIDRAGIANSNAIKLSIAQFISGGGDSYAFVTHDDESNAEICVLSSPRNVTTATALHELGHIVTSSSIEDEGLTKSGLKVYTKGPPSNATNSYLEEVVNEYCTDKITRMAKRRGIAIGENKEEEISSYTSIYPYLADFIEEFLPELNKCRLSRDPMLAEKIFGEDFRNLSKAVDQYFETGLSWYSYKEQCAILRKRNGKNLTSDEKEFRECISNIKNSIKNIRSYVYQNDDEKVS